MLNWKLFNCTLRNENENFLLLFFFCKYLNSRKGNFFCVVENPILHTLRLLEQFKENLSLLLIHSESSLTLELLFPSPIKLFVKKTTHSIVLLLYFLRNLPNENGFCFLFFYYVSVHTQTTKDVENINSIQFNREVKIYVLYVKKFQQFVLELILK